MSPQANQISIANSAFNLADNTRYHDWCERRLSYNKPLPGDLLVDIADPYHLTTVEKAAIIECCRRYNMVIYRLSDPAPEQKTLVHALGRQLGMVSLDANLRSDDDSVSSLEVRQQTGNQYIPYTNKALSWHTDGYYNTLDKQIFGIIMHCVRPAVSGGVNRLLNPENVYIALRDENPAYIEALMHPEAMTIPANIESGKIIRAAQTGPVFMIRPDRTQHSSGSRLHMRFSARKRNIIWHDTDETHAAVAMVSRLMADDGNVVSITLQAGEGIICNNVLHNRTGFTDSEQQKRLIYRARYFEAVTG